MRLEIDIPKHQYNNIMEIDSINLGRVSYKGIIMYAINAIKRGKALEQEPTTKNDLGVDCISRAQTQTEIENHASRYTIAKERCGMGQVEWSDQLIKVSDAVDIIRNLPSVTPQEPQTFKWCTDCKEYDQEKHCCHRWSKVIRNTVEEMKQEYIERDVLDNIYADIQRLRGCSCSSSDGIIDDVEDILDKYKAETEDKA